MEHRYFYEDSVFRERGGSVWFGLVLDNCEASSSSEAEADPLQRGELRVLWHPSGREQVLPEAKVGLADRALMPGDVVRRLIKGKDTQRGYCRDIIVTGAVQVVGSNHVLSNVPSERLQPLEEFTSDLAVCLDSWVGTSKIVHSKLRLISNDGSKLEFPDVNLCLLEDCLQRKRRGGRSSGVEHHAANEFYPGQTVVGPLVALDHAVWLNVTKEMEAAKKHKMREHKFTIECVETESVGVHWQCRALGEQAGGGPPQQPRFLVEGEDLKRLKLLNLFEPCTLQVGAKNFLTITAEDTFTSKAQWKKTQNKIYRTLRKQTRSPRASKPKESPVKDLSIACAQMQETTNTNVHTFRLPAKSKKRLSGYNRDGRLFCYQNLQAQIANDSKNLPPVAKDSLCDDSSKAEQCEQLKMDVDIVIMDEDRNTSAAKRECIEKNNSIKSSISPQRSEEGSHLDIPDVSCNGKCTSSDRSCSPDVDLPERHKKLRKSRVSSTNNSRSASPAVFNGEHKISDPRHDSDSWENSSSDECTDTDSCATWSSQCSSSTNNSMASGRGKKSPHLVTKFFKGKRLKKAGRRNSTTPQPKAGDRVVVETLCTKSKANVVWQDGTIEFGIPSTELYPIHHLDGQECFPGDFVISGVTNEAAQSHRDYGVVQKVDHYGRTAVVKWFRTYTSCQEPVPQFITESEVSVYDLKDHPDFQYRPGTVVIRVANFTGTEASCTAGQVMDNFPSGRVNVWWVDGHTSMCWPQDLYKVGEYDSDDGDIWADEGSSSEDSWETQSTAGDSGPDKDAKDDQPDGPLLTDLEDINVKAVLRSISGELPKVPRSLEPRAAAHIEKGLNGMARLEEILSQNPSFQTHETMRKLLTLYKDCRFLDRLMGTSYFHEDHFHGLLERVREREGNRESGSGNAGVRRVHNQVMRLFSRDDLDGPPENPPDNLIDRCARIVSAELAQEAALDLSLEADNNQTNSMDNPIVPKLEINNSKTSDSLCDNKSFSENTTNVKDDKINVSTNDTNGNSNNKEIVVNPSSSSDNGSFCKNNTLLSPLNTSNVVNKCCTLSPISDGSLSKYCTPSGSMGDLTNQNDKSPNSGIDRNKNEDSGIDSQSISISHSTNNTATSSNLESRNTVCEDNLIPPDLDTLSDAQKSPNVSGVTNIAQLSNRNVCQKLCSMIAKQLLMACTEINKQFDNAVVTVDEEANENTETVTDIKVEEPPQTEANKVIVTSETTTTTIQENEGSNIGCTSMMEFGEGFVVMEVAPTAHRFRLSLLQPSEPRAFHQAVNREIKLLKSDLPPGVWVRGYEDRMDLLSIMIAGPAKTPYEDGLFLFDVQLGGEYPRAPPLCHYISYCSDRLNPNLYEDGKVCVSLLGTWSGRGVEVWGRDSSLLQVIVSLQGLILCAEPYFNEAGFDKQKGSQQGSENSRMYNEMVLLKLVQSLTKMVLHPPEIFKAEIFTHQSRHASSLCDRLRCWMVLSENHNTQHPESPLTPDSILKEATQYGLQPPEYPLIPASRGFCLSLKSSLDSYCNALTKVGISFEKKL